MFNVPVEEGPTLYKMTLHATLHKCGNIDRYCSGKTYLLRQL